MVLQTLLHQLQPQVDLEVVVLDKVVELVELELLVKEMTVVQVMHLKVVQKEAVVAVVPVVPVSQEPQDLQIQMVEMV